MYSDAVVGTIDTTCIPAAAAAHADGGTNACQSAFDQCAFDALNANEPPNPCQHGG
jgi:hypothetical protein